MVLDANTTFAYNFRQAILQEIELAKEHYHEACLLPYYAAESADRYIAARARLEKARALAREY